MAAEDLICDLQTPCEISDASPACSLSDEEILQLKQTSQRLQLAEIFEREVQESIAGVANLSQTLQDRVETLSLVRDAQEIVGRKLLAAQESAEQLGAAVHQTSAEQLSREVALSAAALQEADIASRTLQQAEAINQQQSLATGLLGALVQRSSLLALNATIIATRAGDGEHGYAMVAHDIQDFARQAAQASEMINTQMAAMQQTLDAALSAVTATRDGINAWCQSAASRSDLVNEQAEITRRLEAQLSESIAVTADAATFLSGTSDSQEDGATTLLATTNELVERLSQLKRTADSFLEQMLQSRNS